MGGGNGGVRAAAAAAASPAAEAIGWLRIHGTAAVRRGRYAGRRRRHAAAAQPMRRS